MAVHDDHLRVRPGRIAQANKGARQLKSYVGQAMCVAKKTGHTGPSFGTGAKRGRSSFGRGRRIARILSMRSSSRRVMVKARVVRHRGVKFRSAPLAKHIAYLRRDARRARCAHVRRQDR
jgi:hypothetical protein